MAGLFVRREVYGRYIQELLGDAIIRQGGFQNLFIVPDVATALRPTEGAGLRLETGLGRTYDVEAAVLAVGNVPPPDCDLPGYVADPWREDAFDGIKGELPVAILGTGLTAVDVVLMLKERGFRGAIHALPRHGLLPQVHAPATPWAGFQLDGEDRRSLLALYHAVRRADEAEVDWRCVLDALRPHVSLLWRELAPADRRRFMRHVRSWWDVHRHRMAPPAAEVVVRALQDGSLRIARGRISSIRPEAEGLRLRWQMREGGSDEVVAQRMIDCRGPGTDYARLPDPLIRKLVADGLARPDPCRLGLETTPFAALVGRDGTPSPILFGVEPVTGGTFWEITSVPDIRSQAEQVAVSILDAARQAVATRAA